MHFCRRDTRFPHCRAELIRFTMCALYATNLWSNLQVMIAIPRLISFPALAALAGALLALLAPNWSHAGQRIAKGTESRPDALYHNYCSVCHGDRGDGRSRAQNSQKPPPPYQP